MTTSYLSGVSGVNSPYLIRGENMNTILPGSKSIKSGLGKGNDSNSKSPKPNILQNAHSRPGAFHSDTHRQCFATLPGVQAALFPIVQLRDNNRDYRCPPKWPRKDPSSLPVAHGHGARDPTSLGS